MSVLPKEARTDKVDNVVEMPDVLEQQLFDTAHRAAEIYRTFSRSQVEKIIQAVATAAAEQAEFYADWAVRETGFGDVATKTVKNHASLLPAQLDMAEFIDPQVDTDKKIVSFPKPAGVVVALVPCTNPVATVYYKAMLTLMTRNAVIMCPHPASKECSVHAADLLEKVAVEAGAPAGLIQSVRNPNIPLVNKIMKSDRTSLILATGGPGMVRAAYSSSNPAIGVGAANVASYVHSSAVLPAAAARIAGSVSFDNSLPCTTESVIVADASIADELQQHLVASGVHLFTDADEIRRVREFLFPEGHMNVKAIGKSAAWIAERAGVEIAAGAKVLCIEIESIGKHEPMSKEKMFPVVGFIRIEDGVDNAIETAQAMLSMMGKGHSATIHANDPQVVARYGDALPVCRIAVNAPGVTGSSGIETNLIGGAVIGTGFFGRSSIDENVGPKHLLQWTRVAYNKDPAEVMGDMNGVIANLVAQAN